MPSQVSAPLHVGLKIARTAVWAAALTLTAVKVKQLCYEAADSACTAARAGWEVRLSRRAELAALLAERPAGVLPVQRSSPPEGCGRSVSESLGQLPSDTERKAVEGDYDAL